MRNQKSEKVPGLKLNNLPELNGEPKERVDTWLFQCHSMFEAMRVTDESACVKAAATYLRGNAANWWQHVCMQVEKGTREPLTDWAVFKRELELESQPADLVKNARDRLDKLHQINAVGAYVAEFRKVILQIPDLSDDALIHWFVRGLKRSVQTEVDLRGPKTLEGPCWLTLEGPCWC